MSLTVLSRRLLDYLDRLSDSITTFKMVLYLLAFYLLAVIVLAVDGKEPFTAFSILSSALYLLVISKLLNRLAASAFHVPHNQDSDLITALILTLILAPASDLHGFIILTAAALSATLGKYVITYNNRHVFNPAALGATVAGLAFGSYADWWVGTTTMAPILILGGLIIVRKMRRFEMVIIFSAFYLIVKQLSGGIGSAHEFYLLIASTPLLFLTTVMLTEPLTSPTKRRNIWVYSLVGATAYSFGRLHIAPEEALLIANMVAAAIEPNRSMLIRFLGKRQEANGIYSFIFEKPKDFRFKAGQYMEWTLPGVRIDLRGNRRYMTISASPDEDNLMFSIKMPLKPSRFKQRLYNLRPGQKIVATRLAGEFVLPDEPAKKVALIAGGVGITPFRSMAGAVRPSVKQDINLIYSVNTPEEVAFGPILDRAFRTTYVSTQADGTGFIKGFVNRNIITQAVPDYAQRSFYISGPQAFVAHVRLELYALGVKPTDITTDFFPGYS